MPNITPTISHAHKILELLDFGLVQGLGKPEPGQMCIEAAVNYAFELPHGDKPPCVGAEVRQFKIGLNDKDWSSSKARAKGMKALAIAQLGSNTINQEEFRALLWFRFGTEIHPWIWRFLATKTNKDCRLAFATRMEMSKSLEECRAHAQAHAQAYAYDYVYGYDYAYDYDYVYGYGYGYDYGYDYAYGYGYDYAYGYGYDTWLSKVAAVAVSVLVELKSPGCEWLYLIEEQKTANLS